MNRKSGSQKKPITVTNVGQAALIFALAGGCYGYFTGGLELMAIGFIEWFAGGFVLLYICASFIELLRK